MRQVDLMKTSARGGRGWAAWFASAVLACTAGLGCQEKTSPSDAMEPAPEPVATQTRMAVAPASQEESAEPAVSQEAPAATALPSAAPSAEAKARLETASKSVAQKVSTPAVVRAANPTSKPVAKKTTSSTAKKEETTKTAVAPKAAEPKKAEEPAKPAFTGKPCRQTSFKFSAVRSACKTGGVSKAKSLMKFWTKKAKEKTGKRYKCSACHSSTKTYANKPNAGSDLNAMLKAMK